MNKNNNPFKAENHLARWKNAGAEKNLVWLDSAIKFAKATKNLKIEQKK